MEVTPNLGHEFIKSLYSLGAFAVKRLCCGQLAAACYKNPFSKGYQEFESLLRLFSPMHCMHSLDSGCKIRVVLKKSLQCVCIDLPATSAPLQFLWKTPEWEDEKTQNFDKALRSASTVLCPDTRSVHRQVHVWTEFAEKLQNCGQILKRVKLFMCQSCSILFQEHACLMCFVENWHFLSENQCSNQCWILLSLWIYVKIMYFIFNCYPKKERKVHKQTCP